MNKEQMNNLGDTGEEQKGPAGGAEEFYGGEVPQFSIEDAIAARTRVIAEMRAERGLDPTWDEGVERPEGDIEMHSVRNDGRVVDMELVNRDREWAATEFCEGNDSLKKLLLKAWDNGLETYACCSGDEADSYVAFKYREQDKKALLGMMAALGEKYKFCYMEGAEGRTAFRVAVDDKGLVATDPEKASEFFDDIAETLGDDKSSDGNAGLDTESDNGESEHASGGEGESGEGTTRAERLAVEFGKEIDARRKVYWSEPGTRTRIEADVTPSAARIVTWTRDIKTGSQRVSSRRVE